VQCPYCGGDSRVLDSRQSPDGIRRRRVCNECKRRFTTYERAGSIDLKVIKRDERTEPFDPAKLVRSLQRVTRNRPGITTDDIGRIARAIEAKLLDAGARSVRSGQIVDLALERLRDLDLLAYNRLAANYVDETGHLRTEHRPMTEAEAAQLGLFNPDDD
jgi:transcriptional repressor NrdR